MEFMLPVAVKLFPNMLPSTFEDKSKKVLWVVLTLLIHFQNGVNSHFSLITRKISSIQQFHTAISLWIF